MNISFVKNKIWLGRIAAIWAVVLILPQLIFAVSAAQPEFDFPSCEAPRGELKADYPTGYHAIVEVQGLQYGSDQVYILDDGHVLQCFCPLPSGQGIQSNWLAAGGLSKEEKNNLQTQGWVYIYDGTGWGLQDQPYLVKNLPYNCHGDGGIATPKPTPTPSATPTPTSTPTPNPASPTPTPTPDLSATPIVEATPTPATSTPQPQGQVLGIQTLASTSSSDGKYLLVGLLGLSIGLISYGWYLKKQRSARS